jgi:hypothetical protein
VAAPPVSGPAKLSPAEAPAPPQPAARNQPASPSIPQPASNPGGGPEAQPAQVAFTVTLKPADTAPGAPLPAAAPTLFPTEPPAPPANPPPPASDDLAPSGEKNSRPTGTAGSKQPDPDSEQPQKAFEAGAPAPDVAGFSHILVGPQDSQTPASSGVNVHPASPAPPAPATSPTAAPDEPARSAAAHDIKLQVAGDGEQRVEVRISERGGDVFVAVRTPDSRLAGDLRQNLPALATRLEQSGLHATTWQPGASGARERIADPQSGAAGQDSQGQARQNGREQPRDPQPQKQKGAANASNAAQPGEPGRDFASLLSAIR